MLCTARISCSAKSITVKDIGDIFIDELLKERIDICCVKMNNQVSRKLLLLRSARR